MGPSVFSRPPRAAQPDSERPDLQFLRNAGLSDHRRPGVLRTDGFDIDATKPTGAFKWALKWTPDSRPV